MNKQTEILDNKDEEELKEAYEDVKNERTTLVSSDNVSKYIEKISSD